MVPSADRSAPEKRGELARRGDPPAKVSASTTQPAPRTTDLGALIGLTRTAVGLVIGAAATGIEALLAELTARRDAPSERH